jgi:shikimate dehydrogenase
MDEHVRAVCVIGWPVKHSRSPLIHGYWLNKYGIAGDYRREAVEPAAFEGFILNLAARGYVGANVTLPHKEAALQLSAPDDRARAVGAANTLWLADGRLRSTNTDVEGFIGNLDATAPGWDKEPGEAVVLGAGGAARAVLFGLVERGIGRILLANRTREKAAALAAQFGHRVQVLDWSAISDALPACGLLVNTTSLGMAGQPPLAIALGRLADGAVVADLVYVPLETSLLAQARARGLRTADGLGMLLHQAVRGFSLWFGVRPEVTPELRALVEADLTRNSA